MPSIVKSITSFFSNGHERTLRIRKNVAYTVFSKGLSILIGFLLVPQTIDFLRSPLQYSIWLVIASVVTWMNTFDVGLSNGLRNKLAHALALNQRQHIVSYVSTTYAFLVIIAGATFLLFYVIGSFFNWNALLNFPADVVDAWPLLLTTLGLFCIQFVLQALNSILTAIQQNYKASLLQMIGQALTLISLFLLKDYVQGNLHLLVLVVTGIPVITLLLGHFYFFSTILKDFRPKFSAIRLRLGKELFSLGGVFFLIQIGALILYETDTLVITKVTGPLNVAGFNIAFKYFSLLSVGFSILIAPYWSAFTEAFAKNDIDWIKGSVRRIRLIWLGFAAIAVLLCLCSGIFYKLWIQNKVTVPFTLTLSIAVYTVMQLWTDIHAYLLNGIGKLRVQLILVVVTGVLNIPLSIFLIKHMGLHGTVVANILVLLIINIFLTRQSQLIIHGKARGIWNK